MVLLEEDLIKNHAKTKQPAGVNGSDGGGGGACATKPHIRTFKDLKSKLLQLGNEEKAPSSTLKLDCAKVPQRLRSNVKDTKDYYEPQVMSFGPYHHGKPKLQLGETLKLKLVKTYFQVFHQSEDNIYEIISRNIKALRKCYNWKSTEKYTDEELSVMLLVDGCALLWYILCVCVCGYFLLAEYSIKYQDLSRIQQDTLLLENQLPYQLLHNLMTQTNMPDDTWIVIFQEFFGMLTDESLFQQNQKPEKESKSCHHLLDLYRKKFLGDEISYPTDSEEAIVKLRTGLVEDLKEQVMASFRNVKELMAAGIRIKRSPTRHLRDISFHSNGITACLRIPPITIDSSTKTLFLNLIAYEMSSDVPHDFISYLCFLDSLIDHDDDVKELQSAGILQNNLGTHEQVAEFFNTVSSNLESNYYAYKDVRIKIRKHIESHYNSRLKMWMTQCLDTYFGSPWTIIAWVGAALALFFTAVQTYFAVFHP